jgi:hypothetical protein
MVLEKIRAPVPTHLITETEEAKFNKIDDMVPVKTR